MTAIRDFTRREFLTDAIEMLTEGLAHHTEEDRDLTASMTAQIAGYRAELEQLGEGPVEPSRIINVVENPRPIHKRPEGGARAANQYGEFTVHYATPKQVRFIAFLLESHNLASLANSTVFDLPRLREAVLAGKVNKKAASDAIDRLLACPEIPATTYADEKPAVRRPASEKQVALITKLAAERDWNPNGHRGDNPSADTISDVLAGIVVESRDASAAIDFLFGCAKAPVSLATRDDAGVWVAADGTLFRVYLGQQSGRMLMKKVVGHDLEYVGQARLEGLRRATAEEVGTWGKVTGTCLHCERRLDDPVSVDRGIGPVCWAKYGH